MKCSVCGKTGYEIKVNKVPNKFCSYSCYNKYTTMNKEPNCECSFCGLKMYLKPARIKRLKWNSITCSKECLSKIRALKVSGSGNHQFGLKGDRNSSFKNGDLKKKNHNLKDIYVYQPESPNGNGSGRVLKHRKVVEDNYEKFDIDNFFIHNEKHYLKKQYIVHHINGNHCDNRVENLLVVTLSEHSRIHNSEHFVLKDKNGKITGVFKKGELLGNLEAGNQQPSLSSNALEGSTTNVRDLSEETEVSNNDTSALPLE